MSPSVGAVVGTTCAALPRLHGHTVIEDGCLAHFVHLAVEGHKKRNTTCNSFRCVVQPGAEEEVTWFQ